jgi:hypothetical protein
MNRADIRPYFENLACLARGGYTEREKSYIDQLCDAIIQRHEDEIAELKEQLAKAKTELPVRKWYVIRFKQSGKYCDGFYGTSSNILNEEAIQAEGELLYKPNDRMDFILVAEQANKPLMMDVREKLQEMFD